MKAIYVAAVATVTVIVISVSLYFMSKASPPNNANPPSTPPEQPQNVEEEVDPPNANLNVIGGNDGDQPEEFQQSELPTMPTSSSSNQGAEASSSIVAPKKPEGLNFILTSKIRGQQYFDNWENAAYEIDHSAEYPGDLQAVRVEFPAKIILSYHDEQFFRQWLARLGDYNFSRRIVLVDDPIEVIYHPELHRVTAEDVDKRGCAKFIHDDDEVWGIDIQGLENYPKEIKFVIEKIIFRALSEPFQMAKCDIIRPKTISNWLMEERAVLSEDQIGLADGFMRFTTIDKTLSGLGLKSNLWAYLPLVPFEEVLCTEPSELEKFQKARKMFLRDFYGDVVTDCIAVRKKTIENAKMVYEARFSWAMRKLRDWTMDTEIADLLHRSLFGGEQQVSKF